MKKNFRKILTLTLAIIMLLMPADALAKRHQKRDIPLNGIIVNDHIVFSDVAPYIKNSRTYVPIRFIAEELGFDVKWDAKTKKVSMSDGKSTVELTIGSKTMLVNGKKVKLDAPAEIKDQRTFVPLRAIAEAFGKKVEYSNDYRAVCIGDDVRFNKNYRVVYYYDTIDPVITDYEINIVTYRMIVNGEEKRFETVEELIDVILDDFEQYKLTGKSEYGLKVYREPDQLVNALGKDYYTVQLEPTKRVATREDEIRWAEERKKNEVVYTTEVPEEKQLRDDYYVESTEDILVGSWYGPSKVTDNKGGKLDVDVYTYIESLGGNKYKLTNRTILASDKSSQFFSEQYGYYEFLTQTLTVEKSYSVYGQTGYFVNGGWHANAGIHHLDKEEMRLYWDHFDSSDYIDKY
ncbi:copper amine oxidase N-terminal domain-containing protein [Fenollaria timonensis]|uniref:copper amine oxidase N-terminal domain-containing protein n=1 Tax=Fenollaria timonensis TaxID=1723384 RepID=UPI0026EE0A4E|nr:copper amine oxidase N-terminal domain-containing protein [Fenollaria timonensis]